MKLAFVGQPEYMRIHWADMIKSSHFECYEIPISIHNLASYSPLIGETFDYIFFFRGEFCPTQVLKNTHGIKVAINTEPMPADGRINDELLARFDLFKEINNRGFDIITHYDYTSISWLKRHKINIDMEYYLPISKPSFINTSFGDSWDIAFFGRSNYYRENMLGALKRDFNFIHCNHGVIGLLQQYICMNSKIVLNLNTSDLPSLNPRMQHMMSYGSLVVSEPITHHSMFTPMTHYYESTAVNMYTTIKYILNNYDHEDIEKVKTTGQKRVFDELDCVDCWSKLIGIIK